MTLEELKDMVNVYSSFENHKEVKLSCSQIHGAEITNFEIWNDGDSIHIVFNLDKDVCSSGYGYEE